MLKKKILFIAHEATRTGAPMVLLSFLQWLKKNGNLNFNILLLKDGPMRKNFEDVAKTYFIPLKYKFSLVNKIRRRLYPDLITKYKITEVINKLKKNNYDVIYGNTIVSLPWLLQFKNVANTKIVCAMHELTYVIEYFFNRDYVRQQLKKVDLIIAGSHAVKENLIAEFEISEKKIKVLHAFINTEIHITKSSETLRQKLGIKENEIIIGGLATADLRKGIDMVVPLAAKLKNKYPDVAYKIVWVGGLASDNNIKIIKQDAKKCAVEKQIIFIEDTASPDDYINLYDVFILLSREDPFPLVLLTAAYLQKAIIAFDNSGGASELLNEGAGFLAPYLNVEAVAEIISALYYKPELTVETGKKARERVEKEFSADIIPAKVFKILNEF